MPRNRQTPEQIIRKLREAEVELAKGRTTWTALRCLPSARKTTRRSGRQAPYWFPSTRQAEKATSMTFQIRCAVGPLIVVLLVAGMMVHVSSADAEGAPGGSVREEEDRIRAMWTRFEAFYNKDDADGVVSLFEEGATRFTQKGEVGNGRAEIRKQYVAEFASRKADPTIEPFHAELTIRFLRPDVAILDGNAVWNRESIGQFTVVASKAGGRWLIAAGRPRAALQR